MFAEKLVFRYNRLKKIQNTASLRIFNVYGTDNVNQTDVVSRFSARLSKGLPPIISGDGKHSRDFISVDDVSDGILLSIKAMENGYSGNSSSPVFNIGSGAGTSIDDLARKMIKISEFEFDPIYEEGKNDNGVIMHSYADITRAKQTLHFVPKIELERGLREIIRAFVVRG